MKRFCTLLAVVGLASAPAALAEEETCDYNGDGVCDLVDYKLLSGAINSQEGDPGFIPAGDYDGDGFISPADLVRFMVLRSS